MQHYELSVLTGLHKGALLPLTGTEWIIGSSPNADLVLYDTTVAEKHCRLQQGETGWRITALQGMIGTEEGHEVELLDNLALNTPFSLGDTWLCIAPVNSAWPNKPVPEKLGSERPMTATTVTTATQAPNSAPGKHRKFSALICLLFACVAIAAGVSLRPEQKARPAPPISQKQPPKQKIPLSSATEIAELLKSMFAEKDLLSHTGLEITAKNQIIIHALRDDPALAETKKTLAYFEKNYQSAVPVTLQVEEQTPSLPFQISQVVRGAHPYVLTRDGQQIFINDTLKGIQLLDITDEKLIFQGKQRFELLW